jgi:hypothetical protein
MARAEPEYRACIVRPTVEAERKVSGLSHNLVRAEHRQELQLLITQVTAACGNLRELIPSCLGTSRRPCAGRG